MEKETVVHMHTPMKWKWKVKVKSLSRVWLFATPWTVAYQASLSMGFSRQEYWSGLPFPSPGKNTGVGSHFLLQGLFPIQGSNLGLPHCRQILYHLSHHGKPLRWYLYKNSPRPNLLIFNILAALKRHWKDGLKMEHTHSGLQVMSQKRP